MTMVCIIYSIINILISTNCQMLEMGNGVGLFFRSYTLTSDNVILELKSISNQEEQFDSQKMSSTNKKHVLYRKRMQANV